MFIAFALGLLAPDPLSCFTKEPGSAPASNVCSGTYQLHPGNNVTACATLCLADSACQAIAMGEADNPSSTDCRISHACPKPTSHLDAYDGYTRKPGPCSPAPAPPPAIAFGLEDGLFANGMILQRGASTVVWGRGAAPASTVTVTVGGVTKVSTTIAGPAGEWNATLPRVGAMDSTSLSASDGTSTTTLQDVAFGDVVLCGGQSNMGLGMCGTQSKNQTPSQALSVLEPIRVFFQTGSGPKGGAGGSGCPIEIDGKPAVSRTPALQWFKANATNAGGFSAVCMLTAQRLYAALDKKVPVGAVESCVSGTPVGDWTPSNTSATRGGGVLWEQHMVPLLPMTFKAALWDQGESDATFDAGRTSSAYYSQAFPLMISLWRRYFTSALKGGLPFVYVELCTEYGAEARGKSSFARSTARSEGGEARREQFWLAQRASVAADPSVGFAVTTDIQRFLHPPDKQDVAARLVLELMRIAYGQPVVSRGPELRSTEPIPGGVVLTFSNASLSVRAGILVGDATTCAAEAGNDTMVMAKGSSLSLHYTIKGDTITVDCPAGVAAVHVNSDLATCFLYGPHGLPAPPILANCTGTPTIVEPFR